MQKLSERILEVLRDVPYLVTVHDTDYKIVGANRAAENLLNLKDKDARYFCYQAYHGFSTAPEHCFCGHGGKEVTTTLQMEPHLNLLVEHTYVPLFEKSRLIGSYHLVRPIKKLDNKQQTSETHECEKCQFLKIHELARQPSVKKFTIREAEIFSWIMTGKSSWEIASLMGISENTVKFHVKNVLEKLDAVNRTQAAVKVMEWQLEKADKLMKENHHRIKNNLSVLSSFLQYYSKEAPDQHSCMILGKSSLQARAMAEIQDRLMLGEDGSKHLSVKEIMEETLPAINEIYGADRTVNIDFEITDCLLDLERLQPLMLIATELVTNAYKHAFDHEEEDAEIKILFQPKKRSDKNSRLIVKDNGKGLPKNFSITQDASVGLNLINDLARQIGGRLEVGQTRQGTEFRVIF